MKKVLSLSLVIIVMFSAVLPCVCMSDTVSVSQVVEMLAGIDTLQQMQKKINWILRWLQSLNNELHTVLETGEHTIDDHMLFHAR